MEGNHEESIRSERCLRCNRKLKDEKSKDLGFGKICFAKHQAEQSQQTKGNALFIPKKGAQRNETN